MGDSVSAIGAANAEGDRLAARPMMIAPNFMMVLQISRHGTDLVLERRIALARLP
jgi:hypothetical protein